MDIDILTSAVHGGEKYDQCAKELFSMPKILAVLLGEHVPEFKGMTVEEIVPCIVSISEFEAVDDLSRAALREHPQEQNALTEKIIRFDKLIEARIPGVKGTIVEARAPNGAIVDVVLFIDLELQNKYRLTYPVMKRAMYYVARGLSRQLGPLSEETDYGALRKTYSIWICNEDIPKDEQNSVTRYHIVKEDVIGKSRDNPEDYDMMEVIMIRRGGEDRGDVPTFEFLSGIFSSDADKITKYTGKDEAIEEEVKKMGGFGASLVEKTRIQTQDSMAKLMNYLWRNGRGEDAERGATDRDYLNQLLAEYKNKT